MPKDFCESGKSVISEGNYLPEKKTGKLQGKKNLSASS